MFHVSVMMMDNPVIVQIISVSITVPIMDTSPCATGSSVFAVAAAIGALPSPASLEKIPLAIPFCIATRIAPSVPPAAARSPNALCTMVASAAGISPKCVSRMISTVTTYTSAINGTTTCATEEIRLIPPIITSATHTVSISPDITTLHE